MTSSLSTTLFSLLPLLLLSPSPSIALPTPSSASAAFNCTPYDFANLLNFPRGTPIYTADFLSYAIQKQNVTQLGLSPNKTVGQVAQGTGAWGFEVCSGFEGIDTSSPLRSPWAPGIQWLFGHITYTSDDLTDPFCISVSDPTATNFTGLPLFGVPCEYSSGALEAQRGQIWNLQNFEHDQNAVYLLGPGSSAFNQTYGAGPDSFVDGAGLTVADNLASSSKFFVQNSVRLNLDYT